MEKNHVDSVIIKISKTIGAIAKLRYFGPSTVLVNIYNSVISLYITHGLVAWGSASNAYLKKNFGSSKASVALNLLHRSKRTSHSFIYQNKNSACHVPIL